MWCYKTRWVSTDQGYIEVPCGKCLFCLSNKRQDWAFRLQQEYKASQGACFITLTYHPKFVPDGLNKSHVQKYLKRLRKNYGGKLRYFLVGEYGTQHGRPHYHIILFNYKPEYIDGFIRTAWRIKNRNTKSFESLGIVDIRPLNLARIMYATKYLVQCANSDDNSRPKPFMLCSRAYGIGLAYLTDAMARWHREGQRNYTLLYGQKGRLPRYYKEKLWYPERKFTPADVYSNKPKQNQWPAHPERRVISKNALAEGLKAREENIRLIRLEGYNNPEVIQAQMREALEKRYLGNLAYSQIL